ncbi:MAG: 4Fe-4S binding protein [Elusimicrobia bacterium]|nr:4Fe-4S binding protein [Elusimicrobiota bacterium]
MPLPQNDARRAALVKGASKAKIKALVNLSACTGCEVCIAVCPVPNCIEKFGEDPTSFGVYVNYDICIGCMLCAKDCPWDTIRMVPTPTVAGHQTSLDSQIVHEHAVYEKPELVPEEIRTFVDKQPVSDPIVVNLFRKQNPQVPGMMGPK